MEENHTTPSEMGSHVGTKAHVHWIYAVQPRDVEQDERSLYKTRAVLKTKCFKLSFDDLKEQQFIHLS